MIVDDAVDRARNSVELHGPANAHQRDDDGYLMSPSRDFSTPTYAIVSERANIDVEGTKWAVDRFLGTIRIRSKSQRAVFVGIAPAAIGALPDY